MDELRKGIAIGMLFGSGSEGHGNLMTKTATENGTYTAAEEIDPETGEIFDPPKDGYSVFTVDLALDDKSVSITTSQITGSQTAEFEYDPHDENPELEGYSLFTIDLSAVKDDIEDLQQQVSDLEDELESCHDCREEVVAALQRYDPTYDPDEGECPANKVEEVVDKEKELEEQVEECDQCKADVIAKLQEYDPNFDPVTCSDIPPEIDKIVDEQSDYVIPEDVDVTDPIWFPIFSTNPLKDRDLDATYQVGFTTDDFATFQAVQKLEVTSEPIGHIQIGIKVISTSGGTQSISYYAMTGYWAFDRVGDWIEIMNIYITSDGKTHGQYHVWDRGVHSTDPRNVLTVTIRQLVGFGDPSHTYTVKNG